MTPEFGSPRTAIVTGGARRIGEAFTRALAEDGWHVLIHCSKSVKEAEALAAELANARVVSADLAAGDCADRIFSALDGLPRSEEHTSELQSLMRISYAVFCLKKKK